ncbi:MAG: hypothetical protein KJ077_22280 [Anaerolineae bacterium]|nr:hypothetical protein [Anaerolineae bacterium]
MSDTKIRLKITREVALKADSFYHRAEELGKLAAANLTREHRAQITNLESVTNSALKVTDVLNYLKTQTARREYWQRQNLGQQLLKFINVELVEDKRQICELLQLPPDQGEAQQVHLYLIREFVRQLAAQYEYQCMVAEAQP